MNWLEYQADVPAHEPKFDIDLVAAALADVIQQPSAGALVVGIHGPWGCGKTTAVLRLEKALTERDPNGVYIWFNAWKFQNREALWRALILHVVAQLRGRGGNDKLADELTQSLYRAFSVEEKGSWRVNWRALIVDLFTVALAVFKLDFIAKAVRESTGWFGRVFFPEKKGSKDKTADGTDLIGHENIEKLAGILERETVERQVLQVESIEQFLDKFKDLVTELTRDSRHIYVFIDDLDRCLPEDALQIFESIKLFLDADACRYVVALDRDVIRKGLAVRYGARDSAASGQSLIDPDEYIEKTISLSFDLVQLSEQDARSIIDSVNLPFPLNRQNKQLIHFALGTNPRRLKRFMNGLALNLRIAELSGQTFPLPGAEFDAVLKYLLLNYRYSSVFSSLLTDVTLLNRLQTISAQFQRDVEGNVQAARDARKKSLEQERAALQILVSDEDFWRLMALQPQFPDEAGTIARLQRWYRAARGVRPADAPVEHQDTTP